MNNSSLKSSVNNSLHFLFQGMLNLVYPPSCLHCRQDLIDPQATLCGPCLELMQMIEPTERCLVCFGAKLSLIKPLCHYCAAKSAASRSHFDGVASAFDYAGPAASLVRHFKYSNKPHLAQGMAAYMTAQLLQMQWPIPDIIVPVPITLTHWVQRGYNQSFLLAGAMGRLLNRPVQESLTRSLGDYSQAGLSKKQRMELKGNRFSLKKNQGLQDKSLLLVDDVMTTGSTLGHCGQVLLGDCPARIDAITFCKAME